MQEQLHVCKHLIEQRRKSRAEDHAREREGEEGCACAGETGQEKAQEQGYTCKNGQASEGISGQERARERG